MRIFYAKNIALSMLTLGSLVFTANAQEAPKYRRSALSMIRIDGKFATPNDDQVDQAWNSYPFPDKYDKLPIDVTLSNPAKKEFNGTEVAKDLLFAKDDSVAQALMAQLAAQGVGEKMVKSWYNYDEGRKTVNMSTIQRAGCYDASEMDKMIAQSQARGTASLGDAGIQLIGNSYVVCSQLTFVSNEFAAALVEAAALSKAASIKMPAAQQAAVKGAQAAYEEGKKGYSVWTKTWLFRLDWNDATRKAFEDKFDWNGTTGTLKAGATIDPAMFSLKYVGMSKANNLVVGLGQDAATIINKAVARNVDKVYAQLQKTYDEFKPMTPVLSNDPQIVAQIGMKEGLEGGEKFDVLEQNLDMQTGTITYKKVGSVKVDKKNVWDNRYAAGSEADNAAASLKGTVFLGKAKKVYPGLLLKQAK
jgi:cell division inhibitor SulA